MKMIYNGPEFIVATKNRDGYITEHEGFGSLRDAQACIKSLQEYKEYFYGETHFILQVLEEHYITP